MISAISTGCGVVNAEPIAIVGLGCRFPGASSPLAYWKLLCSGKDATREVPTERWNVARFAAKSAERAAKTSVRRGGFLECDLTQFDAAFFGISDREARHMDPQQRLILEVAWEAIEDAGLDAAALAGSPVGVYVGAFTMDHAILSLSPLNRELIDTHTATGSSMTMLSNRLSYCFDFRGPSITVDTACSGSLVALHLACQAIWNQECSIALAGGVNVMLRPEYYMVMSKGRFLAPDGRCKSFDTAADGYARGEGAGVVILRPLSAALRDGNSIYALVRGTGVNQDGRTDGITVPNAKAQEALIRGVAARYNLSLNKVCYVEAHGTGTVVGDPIEADVLGRTVGMAQGAGDVCYLGSAKGAIGHLEAAAGIAGLIKATLCAHFGTIPPQAGLVTPNPRIPFDSLRLRLPRQVEPLPHRGGTAYLGVNAFGYGGTNAHAILERYSPPLTEGAPRQDDGRPSTLVLSAKSKKALQALARAYSTLLTSAEAPSLRDTCSSAFNCRTHLPHRLVAVANSRRGVATELVAFAERARSEHVVAGKPLVPAEPQAVFVFSGMGPQWWAMGRELYQSERVFRDVANRIDEVFRRLAGYSILDEMLASKELSRMSETQVAQSANFVLQVSLFELLGSWGLHPVAVVGHSVGEVSAACAAGALSLEDAVLLSFNRGRVQSAAAGKGAMLAVGLGGEAALSLVNGYAQQISIAALNGPNAATLSGDASVLHQVAADLEKRGIFQRLLRVEVPYHSHHMDPLKPALRKALARLQPRVPLIPLYSTVTGELVSGADLDQEYWCRNMRNPVFFSKAISSIIAAGHHCFLEVGPHPVLSKAIEDTIRHSGIEGRVFACLKREEPEYQVLLEALGSLHTAGCAVDFNAVIGPHSRRVKLPHYPWQRERHWSESPASARDRLGSIAHPLLGVPVATPSPEYECDLELELLDYLQDHVVDGLQVYPGAGYIEQGLALHRTLQPEANGTTLHDIEFKKALVLSGNPKPKLRVRVNEATREYGVYASPQAGSTEWTLHATGHISPTARTGRARLPLETLRHGRDMRVIAAEAAYTKLAAIGLKYGPEFRRIDMVWCCGGAALALLNNPRPAECPEYAYHLHPSLLDAAIQTTVFALGSERFGQGPLLPVYVRRIDFWRTERICDRLWSYCEVTAQARNAVETNITLCDEEGVAVAQIVGLRCQALPPSPNKGIKERTYVPSWKRESLQARHPKLGPWLLIGGADRTAAELASELQVLGVARTCRITTDQLSQLSLFSGEDEVRGGIVYLSAQPAPNAQGSYPSTEGVVDLLNLAQTILAQERSRYSRLYVVTPNGKLSSGEPMVDPMQAPVIGLGRTIQAEHPQFECTLIDIGDAMDAVALRALAEELTADAEDREIALRGSDRYVCRISREPAPAMPKVNLKKPHDGTGAFKLDIGTAGRLDTLHFKEVERKTPGSREMEIQIKATGINFKDVLKALGMLPHKATEGSYSNTRLGLEASGVVVGVGEAVTEYRIGDELVLAIADSYASHVTVSVDSVFAVRKPARMSFAQAAGLPVCFMTAYYALQEVARLRRGETVLIHAAAGGVGLAAIQVAQWLGAEIIATAGRDSKQEYLRSLGVKHVLNSRDLEFVEEIMDLTGNKGVDVVLNSIGGDALTESLAIMAPLGRFVEIGKRDIVENKKLPMLPFNRNLSFTAFDLDRMMAERPELLKRLFAEVWAHVCAGDFHPTRLEVFRAAEIETAFRHMAQSNHTGKLVVSFEDVGELSVQPIREQSPFRVDASYLITGGLGGFGSRVARWMVDMGARHLILMARSGASSAEARATVAALEAQGATVKVAAVDVSNDEAVADLLSEIGKTMPPLRGIIHAAAVLDDVLLVNMRQDNVNRVMAPKGRGAWILHQLTQDIPLDFFVLFSSVASLIGSPGQGNYVAANAFLDALAHHRRAMGLPAVSVNWGPLSEVGMAARDKHLLEHLENIGLAALSPAEALEALELALQQGSKPQIAFVDVNWSRWCHVNRALAGTPRFSQLVATDGVLDDPPSKLRASLLAVEPLVRAESLARIVAELASETMRTSPDNIDIYRPLSDIGIDSLIAVELQASIQAKAGVEFPILELTKQPSIIAFAHDLLGRMNLVTTENEDSKSSETGAISSLCPNPTGTKAAPVHGALNHAEAE